MSETNQEQKSIPIDQLNAKQLYQIKKSLEDEVAMLNQSLNQFKIAISKYEESKNILKVLDKSQINQELLVPITNSLYIQGTLLNTKSVIIDYGTGFYVERNTVQAQSFCDRKLTLLKESSEKLVNLIQQKANFVEKINQELSRKVQILQQQQQQQQQKQ